MKKELILAAGLMAVILAAAVVPFAAEPTEPFAEEQEYKAQSAKIRMDRDTAVKVYQTSLIWEFNVQLLDTNGVVISRIDPDTEEKQSSVEVRVTTAKIASYMPGGISDIVNLKKALLKAAKAKLEE